jgi:hypothetical protein
MIVMLHYKCRKKSVLVSNEDDYRDCFFFAFSEIIAMTIEAVVMPCMASLRRSTSFELHERQNSGYHARFLSRVAVVISVYFPTFVVKIVSG